MRSRWRRCRRGCLSLPAAAPKKKSKTTEPRRRLRCSGHTVLQTESLPSQSSPKNAPLGAVFRAFPIRPPDHPASLLTITKPKPFTRTRIELVNDDKSLPSEQQIFDKLDLAGCYARLGDKQKALDELEKHLDQMHHWELTFDPVYDPLHNEPRFQALLKRSGLVK